MKGLLGKGSTLAVLGLLAGSAAATAQESVFELEQIADDVYATVVREGISPSQYAASLIVIRTDHVLVVDTRHNGPAASDLLATISELTALPVRYVVNTHWHGDHVQGNAAVRASYRDVQIIGGVTTDTDMATIGRERLDDEISGLEGRIDAARQWLIDGVRTDGTQLTEEEIGSLPGLIDVAEGRLTILRDIELIAPDVMVSDRLLLTDAEPAIEIIRVGPAHTRGDVVVRLPDRGILAIGDLIEDGFPWFGDGYPAGWAEAMDLIEGIPGEMILGAHGPVLRDRKMFDAQRSFVRAIADAARAAAEQGWDIDEALARADFSEFEEHFTARLIDLTAEERHERFAGFVREVMARALMEAAGELDS
jgi:glyoxylase-like metal-dependent hydrolase (beta-lactamase superfamily II)